MSGDYAYRTNINKRLCYKLMSKSKISKQKTGETVLIKFPRLKPRTANLVSNAIYVLLNIVLVLSIVGVVDLFNSPWLGLVIVAISKWRVFSVQIRFWWANLASNFTDLLVGISYVFLISYIGYEQIHYQIGLAGLYLIWLLLIKPGTTVLKIMMQGLIAIFATNVVLSLFAYDWHIVLFLLAEMFVAYNVMGHYLKNSEFDMRYTRLMSGVWAVTMAELAWIYWHWMIGYPFLAGITISQFAITSTLITFLAYKALNLTNQAPGVERRYVLNDLITAVIFTIILVIIMILFFSKPALKI